MSAEPYDSAPDTRAHIDRVRELLENCQHRLEVRAQAHDLSKLEEPEKSAFDRITPKLKSSTYGSPEYNAFLEELKPALDHHYAHNSHHPEHFATGVNGMSLFDVLEMLMDWKAASERHENGSVDRSIQIGIRRFNLSPQLTVILFNTAREMGWIK